MALNAWISVAADEACQRQAVIEAETQAAKEVMKPKRSVSVRN